MGEKLRALYQSGLSVRQLAEETGQIRQLDRQIAETKPWVLVKTASASVR